MDEKHLLELRLKEENYWWHVNKRQLVLKFLEITPPLLKAEITAY